MSNNSIFENDAHVVEVMKNIECYDMIKDRLIVRLANKNSERVKINHAVQKPICGDMVAYYSIMVDDSDTSGEYKCRTFTVTEELFKQYGVSLDKLHNDAVHNIERIAEPRIFSVIKAAGLTQDEGGDLLSISNDRMRLGAGIILCPSVQKSLHAVYPDGFVVVPSSIDDLIINSMHVNIGDLSKKVHEVSHDESATPKDVFLTDRPFFIDAESFDISFHKGAISSDQKLFIQSDDGIPVSLSRVTYEILSPSQTVISKGYVSFAPYTDSMYLNQDTMKDIAHKVIEDIHTYKYKTWFNDEDGISIDFPEIGYSELYQNGSWQNDEDHDHDRSYSFS